MRSALRAVNIERRMREPNPTIDGSARLLRNALSYLLNYALAGMGPATASISTPSSNAIQGLVRISRQSMTARATPGSTAQVFIRRPADHAAAVSATIGGKNLPRSSTRPRDLRRRVSRCHESAKLLAASFAQRLRRLALIDFRGTWILKCFARGAQLGLRGFACH